MYEKRQQNALNCSLCKREFDIFEAPEKFDCLGSGIGDALLEEAKITKEKGQLLMISVAKLLKKIETAVAESDNDIVGEAFVSRWKLEDIDSGKEEDDAHENWHALYQGTSQDRHAHEHMHYRYLELAQERQDRVCGKVEAAQKEEKTLNDGYQIVLINQRTHDKHGKELPYAKEKLVTVMARINALKVVIADL